MKFMVETVDEEEEVYTAANIRYTNRQRHKTTRYEPKFQGKRYKDDPEPCYSTMDKHYDPQGTNKTKLNR